MSGTDPNDKSSGKAGEPSQSNDGGAEHALPKDLPKIPGITLHYEIARGGMGVVYSGRQDFLDRRVAVKFLSMDLGGDAFAQRFQREAKILAGISHPNIVGCHMADTTPEGQSYLVMEFCDGPSLKAWIAENGPVAPLSAIRLIRASARALSHAHQSDIIHRDVKPENILLESVTSTTLDIGFPFTPKIVDLGLARMTHEQVGVGLTSPGAVMGTPSTMSPEQFDDPDSVDFRSDIYGLGCCLYEMLVGQPAFRGSKLTDIVLRKRDPNAPNPISEHPGLPAAVGAFTQRLLASNRDDRPSSYKQLDAEADQLIAALMANPGPAADDEMDRTIVSGPGSFSPAPPAPSGMDATMPMGVRPGAPVSGAPVSGAPVTGPPGSSTAMGHAPVGNPGQTTQPAASDGTGAYGVAPSNSGSGGKRGLLIAVGLAVVAAVAFGVVTAMGGGATGSTPNGAPPDPSSSVPPAVMAGDGGAPAVNTPPDVGQIQLLVGGKVTQSTVLDLGSKFELLVEAQDSDGDELVYHWNWPRMAMSPMSQTDARKILFRLDDGLPGVEYVLQLKVNDGKTGGEIIREFRIAVGNCEVGMPLLGFAARKTWENVAGRWIETTDLANPANGGVVGRAKGDQAAVLIGKLPSDDYWEYSGSLEPTAEADGEAVGMITVKFGATGYAVKCSCTNDETEWLVELLEQVPGQEEWRSTSPATTKAWTRPEESDGETRGWFCIRRLDKQMTVEIGEFALPAPELDKPLAKPTIVPAPIKEITLSEDDCGFLRSGGQAQLVVFKARCVYRINSR